MRSGKSVDRTTLSGRLKRMSDAGEIRLVRAGKGKAASIYSKSLRGYDDGPEDESEGGGQED